MDEIHVCHEINEGGHFELEQVAHPDHTNGSAIIIEDRQRPNVFFDKDFYCFSDGCVCMDGNNVAFHAYFYGHGDSKSF
jgi:hypothetical protein